MELQVKRVKGRVGGRSQLPAAAAPPAAASIAMECAGKRAITWGPYHDPANPTRKRAN